MSQMRKVFNSVIKGIDDKEMTLTALISTNAIDRMDEVLDPKGVDLKHYRNNPVVLWAHDYEKPPIGKALWVKRGPEGVLSKVKFANTEFAQEIFSLYKEGFLNAFSVGFIPKEWDEGGEKQAGRQPRRTFTKWEMIEYSAVPVPANPEALQLAMKKGILKTESLIEDMQKEIDEDWDEDLPEIGEKVLTSTSIPKGEDPVEVEVKEKNVFEELMAENELLRKQVDDFTKQVNELNYKLYVALKKNHDSLSEIADNVLSDKIGEIVDGAVRKALGKVE